MIWAGDNRDFAPCWRVRQFIKEPLGDWEVLVDANSGAIRRVADVWRAVGRVFPVEEVMECW